jgi:plastocyanin
MGAPLGLALALVMSMQGTALAATSQVSIVNFAFDPASSTIKIGGSVQWTNTTVSTTHTSTSDGFDLCCPNGPALWASGNIVAGGTFTFAFVAAGSYTYHCSIHTFMTGTIKVKGKAKPKTGGVTTTFKITWATAIPSGYVANVQLSKPTGGGFQPFLTGTTKTSATFTPNAGTGTYRFRAQLQQVANPALISGFSPSISIAVS